MDPMGAAHRPNPEAAQREASLSTGGTVVAALAAMVAVIIVFYSLIYYYDLCRLRKTRSVQDPEEENQAFLGGAHSRQGSSMAALPRSSMAVGVVPSAGLHPLQQYQQYQQQQQECDLEGDAGLARRLTLGQEFHQSMGFSHIVETEMQPPSLTPLSLSL
ncbi:hypothetical protein DFQ26_005306 [Actinomortierella ambigua]|nr:hypothetical protein DFQ26_005306 [Actinomortierella ambigua]